VPRKPTKYTIFISKELFRGLDYSLNILVGGLAKGWGGDPPAAYPENRRKC
jgi:hypothetical protein